jgi:cytochrome c oxidase subunit III
MQALPAAAPPAPRRQLTVGAALAAMALLMLTGGMLAVWAVQRNRAIDLDGTWVPDGITIPEVPTNVILITFLPLCVFAQWAVWSARRGDHPHTGLALGATALMALLVINAQAYVYTQTGLGIADGPYGAMFYAVTGMFVVLMIAGIAFTAVTLFRYLGGRTGEHELVVAHAIYWYATAAAYAAIWFVVYVTK